VYGCARSKANGRKTGPSTGHDQAAALVARLTGASRNALFEKSL